MKESFSPLVSNGRVYIWTNHILKHMTDDL